MRVFAMEGRIFGLFVLCLVMASVGALQVVIPMETYEFARGDNITLPCTFTTKKPGSLVIITWSVEAEKINAEETVILSYYSDPETTDIKSMYEGRVQLDFNIATGKANLKLSSITLADNKVFECRVLIPGDDEGTPADTARLVVLVAPSKPLCEIQGRAEYGQNINLTCRSEEGSPPPTYKWESRDVRNMPRPVVDPRTTDKDGILSLYNISKETSGYYTCTSKNKIRSATCNITLSVMPPSLNVGSTTIIIVVVIAVLLLLAIITFFCCRHHKKKKEREAYAMGVRKEEYEDKEEPPRNGESRRADGQEDNRDTYDERSERGGGGDRRRDYDDRRSDYDDRRSDYDDRRSDYTDRRSDYDDRRKDYDDRRSDYDDRRSDYDDRRDRERSNDNRRYDDARRYDDRYDEPYDDRNSDRPPVPNNKPPRRDYDD